MTKMIWNPYFIEAQGFTVDESVLLQHNICAMLLDYNRMTSSSEHMKHIRVGYYFIKDHIYTVDIVVKHCPTEKILSDHFTKPLQGALFQKFRAEIELMGPFHIGIGVKLTLGIL